MARYFNSTFSIKPGASRMKRSPMPKSQKPMKRGGRIKIKREPPALVKAKRIARERDGYTCQFPGCGKRYKNIDAHHIAKRSQRPDLRLDPNNLICLCREHHSWTDTHHDEAVRMSLLNTESYELAKKKLKEAA
jgi:5-methylcytosine-specific restriction enzyme A